MFASEAHQTAQQLAPPAAAAVYEETHVHGVYEAIAPHFSATRHKPWPFVSSFLAAQPPGSVGFDVGCGNGKNMGVNRNVVMLGCDRSAALIALAKDLWCTRRVNLEQGECIPGADVAVADGLQLPFRGASADFVICIAVVHHLSTRERRIDAIRQLLQCIRRNKNDHGRTQDANSPGDVESRGGGVLVYVWALEQTSSRRGWGEGNQQDQLVPWVIKAPQHKKQKKPLPPKGRKQKQKQGLQPAVERREVGTSSNGGEGGEVMQGNRQQSHGKQRDAAAAADDADDAVDDHGHLYGGLAVEGAAATVEPDSSKNGGTASSHGQPQPHTAEDKTFYRFYHLYKKGELEEDVRAAGGRVLRSGYERDNWWVIAGWPV
ncbi:unnamed protein product [Discula destructiva]